jgi:PIN domain nuclease of toxin-antitoxin system
VTTVLLDTHVVQWYTAESHRLSSAAREAIALADDLVIAAISWYELAWLVEHKRITIGVPLRSWLSGLASQMRTISVSPAIAATAIALPDTFPRDPADRMIYATAVENGWQLVTKDVRMRRHRFSRQVTVW